MKKLIIFLLGFVSIYSNAQDSTVDEIKNEFLPSMSSSQREALNAFELLKVIDTDDNATWIYQNAKWQRLFSKEAIQQANQEQINRLNSNESWKKFDEESRPESNVSPSNQSSVGSNLNSAATNKATFRYEVITSETLAKNGLKLSLESGEKIAYMKVYTNNFSIDVAGFNHVTTREEKSILLRPSDELSNQVSLSFVKVENKNTSPLSNLSDIKGVLIAYAK